MWEIKIAQWNLIVPFWNVRAICMSKIVAESSLNLIDKKKKKKKSQAVVLL